MGVVVAGVSPHLGFWTAGIDHAILRNVVVVADALEASCLVAGFQLLYCEILVDSCGTAMYHDQVDFSWIFHCFLVINDLTSLAITARYAERTDDGGEDGDDEIYYFLDGFFLHDFFNLNGWIWGL